MWTTAAASQDSTAPHRRQAWATSVQSRGQTNTAVEHMQSWKGCICMVQIPLGGKYTWAFKEKRNKPTHVAHLKYFCAVGAFFHVDLPVWSIIPWLQPGINVPTSEVNWACFPLLLLSYVHGLIERYPAQDTELVSTFHVALGNGKNRMDEQHTHMHAQEQRGNGDWSHITTHFLAEISDLNTPSTSQLWVRTLCACLSSLSG